MADYSLSLKYSPRFKNRSIKAPRSSINLLSGVESKVAAGYLRAFRLDADSSPMAAMIHMAADTASV